MSSGLEVRIALPAPSLLSLQRGRPPRMAEVPETQEQFLASQAIHGLWQSNPNPKAKQVLSNRLFIG